MKGKAAQMEMIGLVVIVILLTLGMLFMAQFALKAKPEKKIYTRKGLASSTMAALTKTTVPDCGNLRIEEDFLEDCAVNSRSGDEDWNYQHRCRGKNSCAFLREIIPELLSETLDKWNKRYEFRSKLISEEELLFPAVVSEERGGCQKHLGDRDTSGEFYINTERGLVESVLYICD